MNQQQQIAPADNGDALVAQQTKDGFSVYSTSNPQMVYQVWGTKQKPQCNCSAFQSLQHQPGFACDHIRTVMDKLPDQTTPAPTEFQQTPPPNHGVQELVTTASPTTLSLKRSVSPDGRIDSLSVELSLPVDGQVDGTLVSEAQGLLQIQDNIVREFLTFRQPMQTAQTNGQGYNAPPNQNPPNHNVGYLPPPGNSPIPAFLTVVAGTQTRYGWKMYLVVQANGQNYKLFGSHKQLEEQLQNAGYPHLAGQLQVGTQLNVPCMAILKQSQNGKYVNCEKIFPPANSAQNGIFSQ